MAFKTVISIRHFLLDGFERIDTPVFTITNHAVLKKQLIDLELKRIMGIKADKSFSDNTMAFKLVDEKPGEAGYEEHGQEFITTADTMSTFLLFLWFIKDNSIGIDEMYGQFTQGKRWKWWSEHSQNSFSDGRFMDMRFSQKEVLAATELLLKFSEICPKKQDERDSFDFSDPNSVPQFKAARETQMNENRLERAMAFLKTARTTPYLPHKITHYMSILECLLSTDASEAVQKVSERTAYYIGENRDERITLYQTIKNAYDIRSKFVHGQKPSKKQDPVALSSQVDDIIRRVLKNIILTDSSVFLGNEADLVKFLNQLIFV